MSSAELKASEDSIQNIENAAGILRERGFEDLAERFETVAETAREKEDG